MPEVKASKLLILFSLLLLFGIIANAQQPVYINYTIAQGLPSNTVFICFQDSKGYMWFGTDKGVSRFNGGQFQNFTTTDGLADNTIFDIFEDSRGKIWFSGFNGLPCYYFKNSFYNSKNDTILSKINGNSIGLKVLEDKHGNIIILTHYKLFIVGTDGKIESKRNQQGGVYCSMSKNSKNEIIVIHSNGIENITTGKQILFKSHELNNPQMNSKCVIHNENLYHTQRQFLIGNNIEKEESETEIISISKNKNLTQSIYVDASGRFWIGTQNGLYQKNNNVVVFNGFEGASISSIIHDHENNVWLSTLNKGIFLSINQKISLLNKGSGLDFDKCHYITVLENGVIAFGANEFKCAFIKNNKITNVSLPLQFGEGNIENIRLGPDGLYYISIGAAIYLLNWDFKVVKIFDVSARDILFPEKEYFLLSTANRVHRVPVNVLKNLSHEELIKATNNTNYTLNIQRKVNQFYKGPSGVIYAFGIFGINTIIGDRVDEFINGQRIIANNINGVQETKSGIVWLATSNNGLLAIKKNKSIPITFKDGLSSNFVNSILLENESTLWAATTDGICKIVFKDNKQGLNYSIQKFNQLNGLVSKSINNIIILDDTLFTASDEGVCKFHQKDLIQKSEKPRLIIESLTINDLQPENLNTNELDYTQNHLKISFIGLSFSSLNKITYKYRIAGLDDKWNYTSANFLDFPAIPPGTFKFELQALNGKQISSTTKFFQFTIKPPFWSTTWFRLLLIVLAMATVSIYLRRQIQNLKIEHTTNQQLLELKNKNLENEKANVVIQKELIELEYQALRLHMNPHFIFNAINAIQGFYAINESERARTYISKFSSLLRMILDSSKEELISLKEEIAIIETYLQLNMFRFEGKFDYLITVDPLLNIEKTLLPPMLTQTFIENGIIHGIASLQSMGRIKVSYTDDGDFIICCIEDNGIGRKKSSELKIDHGHKSTGIEVTKKRINMHNQGAIIASQFVIDDVLDQRGEVAGTKVSFRIQKSLN